ncbi:hypothetical protein ACFQO4_20915 [Saliphagus sp. GCM10025334]
MSGTERCVIIGCDEDAAVDTHFGPMCEPDASDISDRFIEDPPEPPECPVCGESGDVREAPDAGYWTCFECGERGSGSADDVNWWRNDPESLWYVESDGGRDE